MAGNGCLLGVLAFVSWLLSRSCRRVPDDHVTVIHDVNVSHDTVWPLSDDSFVATTDDPVVTSDDTTDSSSGWSLGDLVSDALSSDSTSSDSFTSDSSSWSDSGSSFDSGSSDS